MVRIVLGFAAAALWLPLLEFAVGRTYGGFWFAMTAIYTVPLTLLFAVPLFYAWRRRITLWRCLIGGFVIGVVGAMLFLLMTNPLAALNWSPLLIAVGVLSSLVFWVTGVWKNTWFNFGPPPQARDAAI